MKNIIIAIAILVISVISVSTLIGLINHLYTCYKGWFILILYAFCFLMIYSEVKNHRSKKNNTDNHTKLKEGKTKINIKHNSGVKKYPPPPTKTNKKGLKTPFLFCVFKYNTDACRYRRNSRRRYSQRCICNANI